MLAVMAALSLLAAACGSNDTSAEETSPEASAPASTDTSAETDDNESDTNDSAEDSGTNESAEDVEEPEEPEEPASEGTDPVEATVGIVNIAPVRALELVQEGFAEGMAACAQVNVTIDYRNAEGDGSQLGPIVAEFVDSDVDLILAISTPALQATVAANEADGRETPVLFGAVTDPFAAGAAAGPDDKPAWLTGWQADAPVTGMFDIAETLNPDVATIGIAFDPSQVNSEIAVAKMQAEADARGIAVETATIGDSSEVGTAANTLASRDVDFFFVPTDSILVNGLAGMAQVADDFDIPMIAQDSGIAAAGAAVGTGLDYYGDGQRNAEYACEILAGNATPADYSIQQFPEELIGFNVAAAEAQGVELPAEILDNGIALG